MLCIMWSDNMFLWQGIYKYHRSTKISPKLILLHNTCRKFLTVTDRAQPFIHVEEFYRQVKCRLISFLFYCFSLVAGLFNHCVYLV